MCKASIHICRHHVVTSVQNQYIYIYIYIQSWGMDGSLTSVSPVLSSFLIFGERLVLLFGRLFT